MSEVLKPCPFCGGEAAMLQDGEDDSETGEISHYRVICMNCGIEQMPAPTKEEAGADWNRRAVPYRRWEAGSEPPDGWYFLVEPYGVRVESITGGLVVGAAWLGSNFESWESWVEQGWQFYGPIPEPEAEQP